VVQQQQYHVDANYPTGLMLASVKEFLSSQQRRIREAWEGADNGFWNQPINLPIPSRVKTDLVALARPKEVGEHLRLETANPLVIIDADTSHYGVGGQITNTINGRKQNIQLELTPGERARDHTPQEVIGGARVVVAGYRMFPEAYGPEAPHVRTTLLGNDNTSATKNWNRPGPKTSMVDPMVQAQIMARQRRAPIVAIQMGKKHMDDETPCDRLGREYSHYGDWGVQPVLVEQALKTLGMDMAVNPTVDLFASGNTVQPGAESAISRWPQDNPMFLARPGALSYHWGQHPALKGRQLYAHPPPTLIPRVLQKVEDDNVEVVLTTPIYQHKPLWWQTFVEMTTAYTVIPWHPQLHVHPKGREHSDDTDMGWSLITAKLSPRSLRRTAMTLEQPTTCYNPTPMKPVDSSYFLGPTTQTSTTTVSNLGNLWKIEAKSY